MTLEHMSTDQMRCRFKKYFQECILCILSHLIIYNAPAEKKYLATFDLRLIYTASFHAL